MTPDHDDRLIRLAPEDNICVAARSMAAGETVAIDGVGVTLAEAVPVGHKIAARTIAAGERVLKYGAPIGSATRAIAPGEIVHVHNLKSDYIPTFDREGGGAYAG